MVPFRHINNDISFLIKLLFKGQTREISTIKNKGGEDRSNYNHNTIIECKSDENQEDNFGCAGEFTYSEQGQLMIRTSERLRICTPNQVNKQLTF